METFSKTPESIITEKYLDHANMILFSINAMAFLICLTAFDIYKVDELLVHLYSVGLFITIVGGIKARAGLYHNSNGYEKAKEQLVQLRQFAIPKLPIDEQRLGPVSRKIYQAEVRRLY